MASPILKLRATKKPGEGWPICEVGNGWWLEADGMRASDVADAISGLGGYEGLAKVFAEAPTHATERDTLIRQRAADIESLNAVQAMHAQAVAERDDANARAQRWQERCIETQRDRDTVLADLDEARRQVEAMRALIREYAPPPVWREADALAVPSTEGGVQK